MDHPRQTIAEARPEPQEPPSPVPLATDRWPEFTVAGDDDVAVAGISLLRLVDWCGTPCVHTAAAVIPGTHGRPSENELASVLVARVQAVELHDESHGAENSTDNSTEPWLEVWLDAELDGCRPVLTEAHLIGRAASGPAVHASIRPATAPSAAALLPADLRAGDLVAIPCVGATSLHDVRPHHARPSVELTEELPSAHCSR